MDRDPTLRLISPPWPGELGRSLQLFCDRLFVFFPKLIPSKTTSSLLRRLLKPQKDNKQTNSRVFISCQKATVLSCSKAVAAVMDLV